jgi:prepilin-type N-terminal cleavage/methylation domain-containing protein
MYPIGRHLVLGRKDGGFTLLEVMIAMAIFSIGILGVVGMQHLVVRGTASGNAVTQELMLAQRIMEEMKNTQNPATLTGFVRNNLNMEGEPGGPYTVQTRVVNPPLGTPPVVGSTARYIEVTVTKAGLHGHPITIRTMTHGHGI